MPLLPLLLAILISTISAQAGAAASSPPALGTKANAITASPEAGGATASAATGEVSASPATGAASASAATSEVIGALVQSHEAETIADRRWLHRNAELSLREHKTQAYLREKLAAIPGVEMIEGDWGTGLVARLSGARPGPLLAYRADIDALPIAELTGLPFACTSIDTTGGRDLPVMHACGHDLHAAVLLGTARVLSDLRESMRGSVLFVIEPGEEVGAGAAMLLEAGLFDGERKPEAIFAMHDHSTIPYGQIAYCPGRSAANVDDFYIKVLGRGSHGAYPHRGVDPIVIASEMVLAFQSIVSREVDAARSAVLTVGQFHAGTKSNVIPDYAELNGTVRSLEPEVRTQMQEAVLRTAKGIAAARGAPEPEITYVLGTPSMYNDPKLVEETLPVLERTLGAENVVRYEPGMGGEDFSEYQARVPGFMFRLGVGGPGREAPTHTATFDPDERAIPLGMRLMAAVLLDRLERLERLERTGS